MGLAPQGCPLLSGCQSLFVSFLISPFPGSRVERVLSLGRKQKRISLHHEVFLPSGQQHLLFVSMLAFSSLIVVPSWSRFLPPHVVFFFSSLCFRYANTWLIFFPPPIRMRHRPLWTLFFFFFLFIVFFPFCGSPLKFSFFDLNRFFFGIFSPPKSSPTFFFQYPFFFPQACPLFFSSSCALAAFFPVQLLFRPHTFARLVFLLLQFRLFPLRGSSLSRLFLRLRFLPPRRFLVSFDKTLGALSGWPFVVIPGPSPRFVGSFSCPVHLFSLHCGGGSARTSFLHLFRLSF